MVIHINKKMWEVTEIQRRGEGLEILRGKSESVWIFFRATGKSELNHAWILSSLFS